jgi:hypothetical protein
MNFLYLRAMTSHLQTRSILERGSLIIRVPKHQNSSFPKLCGSLSTKNSAVARVRARVWSCGICGRQSGAGAGFLRILRFPLSIFIPPIAPQSPSSIIWGLYNRPEVAVVPSGLSPTSLIIKNNNNRPKYQFSIAQYWHKYQMSRSVPVQTPDLCRSTTTVPSSIVHHKKQPSVAMVLPTQTLRMPIVRYSKN